MIRSVFRPINDLDLCLSTNRNGSLLASAPFVIYDDEDPMDDIEKKHCLQDAVVQSRGGNRDEFNIKSIGLLKDCSDCVDCFMCCTWSECLYFLRQN